MATLLGLISLGLGVSHVWSINSSQDEITSVQGAGSAVIGALVIAIISTVVTYLVDKKYGKRT